MDFVTAVGLLEKFILEIPGRFAKFSKEDLLRKPAPGKWSRLEILGHLVDSALNNLKRFTESQFLPQPYQVPKYMQEEVVTVNGYQQLPLEHVMAMWVVLNSQVLYVMSALTEESSALVVVTTGGEVKTLEWLMVDYVEHMEHHWRQVFG